MTEGILENAVLLNINKSTDKSSNHDTSLTLSKKKNKQKKRKKELFYKDYTIYLNRLFLYQLFL